MGGMGRAIVVVTGTLLACAAVAAPEVGPTTYTRLKAARFSVAAVDLPETGVEIKQDLASFRMESGSFRPMEPAAETVTGFVFQGKGRFRFDVPNAFELAQLRRFTRDRDIATIDTAFTTLIVRTSSALRTPVTMTFP